MAEGFMTRRQVMAAGVFLAASSEGAYGSGVDLIYKNWTQEQLDDQINQISYSPHNLKEIIENYARTSNRVRSQLPYRTFSYGNGPNEKLDVFAPEAAKHLPVMVFIHGGAWTAWTKDDFSSAAPTFTDAKAVYVVLGFDNIPPNTMGGLVDQCRKALAWVRHHADEIGADPKKIYVSGHSSGGHLANMMLATEWKKHGLPADVIKGGVVLSGWTDLNPISLSNRNSYLKLGPTQIKQFSPINFVKNVTCPVIVAWGGLESPYMQTQSAEWARALQSEGRLVGVYRFAGYNHFEMPNLLNNKETEITRATLALMGLI